MFDSSTSPITVFEIAPNGSGGEIFWIYDIEKPDEFFAGCETVDDASERLIESDRSPDEQIETCGYTLVLDHPEDPPSTSSLTIPEGPLVFEAVKSDGQHERYEFYRIEDPEDTFGDSYGDTQKMFDSIVDAGIEPMLEYGDVSLTFQRPYGAL
ncbi:hypothetical protein ACFQJ5_05545 [Halomicroarcula sp. GCM10025324]|uniref:hypothetical protein n=1 Tax=Haloarcula TaxID=2237 RepID=UPI0023E8B1AE|nr:hypothetical protein [Halomicroarcula sp. ZS-22-S1]